MREVTVGGLPFTLEDRYAEGHTLNANEAAALNQTRAENIGNNFRSDIIEAREKAWLAANGLTEVPEGTKVPNDQALDAETLAALAAAFTEKASSYEFGVRSGGGGGRVTDPVQKEAKRIATETVTAAIKSQYGKLDAVDKERFAALVAAYAAKDETQALARENVERARALAGALDL